MGNLAAWALGLAWPVVSKVLTALGVGIVSYTGVSVAFGLAVDQVRYAAGSVTGDMAQILAMTGMFESFSIVLGAYAAHLALQAMNRIMVLGGS